MNWVEKKESKLKEMLDKYAMMIGTTGVIEIMIAGRYIFNPEGLTQIWVQKFADKWSPDHVGYDDEQK